MQTAVQYSRQPLIRLLSGSSNGPSRSTSGSIRFSRTTNTSIKSTNVNAHASLTKMSIEQKKSPDVLFEKCVCPLSAAVHTTTTSSDDCGDRTVYHNQSRSRREIFSNTVSIPTTINEESSRTISPYMERVTFTPLSQVEESFSQDDVEIRNTRRSEIQDSSSVVDAHSNERHKLLNTTYTDTELPGITVLGPPTSILEFISTSDEEEN